MLVLLMIVFLLDPLAKVLDAGPETDSGGPAVTAGLGELRTVAHRDTDRLSLHPAARAGPASPG